MYLGVVLALVSLPLHATGSAVVRVSVGGREIVLDAAEAEDAAPVGSTPSASLLLFTIADICSAAPPSNGEPEWAAEAPQATRASASSETALVRAAGGRSGRRSCCWSRDAQAPRLSLATRL